MSVLEGLDLSVLELEGVLDASALVFESVLVRSGPAATSGLRACGRVAAARGRTIAVSSELFALPRLVRAQVGVHELVHVLQQVDGAVWCRRDDSAAELEHEAMCV